MKRAFSPLRKPLDQIHDSGQRAAKVVADLLTIARGVAAVQDNICLNSLVRAYLASPEVQKVYATFPSITFETRLDADLWTTACSAVHIQKCLLNLVNNIAEAFPATYLKSQSADLIILDMIIEPGLNGRETYEAILAIQPNQKAIISSGFADSGEVAKIQALGAGKFVKKTYTMKDLDIAVRQALGEVS